MSHADKINALIHRARERWDAMTPEQKAEWERQQAESWARAEASWPEAKFRMVDGVKVYESYEDYCND